MARWVNVTKPFDYRWPGLPALTAFTARELGDQFVKDEIADFAVAMGYASEGKADASSRSLKGGNARRVRRSRRKEAPAATPADTGGTAPVGDADAADADRPADRPPMDHDAG